MRFLLLLLLFASCGSKKVSKTKMLTETTTKEITVIKQDKIISDSTVTYYDIETLNLVARDSTKPITIIDSKGNKKTFYNVSTITSIKDRSVLRNALNSTQSDVTTHTLGQTSIVKQDSTQKDIKRGVKIYIYLAIGIMVIILLARVYKRLFFLS